jgi:hypothetical protein
MEALLKKLLKGGSLGPTKNKVIQDILERSEAGVHAADSATFMADMRTIEGFILDLSKGTNATGVKGNRILSLKAVQDHMKVMSLRPADAVASAAPNPFNIYPMPPPPAPAAPAASPAAPAAAAPAPSPAAPRPVKTKKTRTDGDCFFSSIFRAANEQGLLPLLATCNPLLQTCSESAFILSFRAILAQEIRAERLPMNAGGSINTYDSLMQLGDDEVYKGTIEAFPDWFQAEFPTLESLGTQKQFVKRLASYVAQSYNDVGMIEVNLAQTLLARCPLYLDVITATPAALAATRDGVPVITLQNQGEGHYEYFSFNAPRGKAKGGSRTRRLRLRLRLQSRRSRSRRSRS